jgi:membrane-associated phospholipid phosphatase
MQALQNVGNLLPFAMIGISGAMSLSEDDPKLSRASFASLSAGGMAALSTLGLKYAVGRARPEANLGSTEFTPFSKDNGDSSFPSMHTAVAWATLTPYAKAYDAPWLYGLAALTNVARINERKHWLSDTVAGAFLGYGLGSLFYENRRRDSATPSLYVTPGEIGLEWVTP